MRAVQVIRDTTPKAVELDSRAHDVSGGQFRIHGGRQVLGLQDLELECHRQAILGAAVAKAHERLPALDHGAAGKRLETVEVGETCRIRFLAPIPPQRVDRLTQGEVRHHRLRLDAGADGIRHEGLDPGRRPGIAANEIPALGA